MGDGGERRLCLREPGHARSLVSLMVKEFRGEDGSEMCCFWEAIVPGGEAETMGSESSATMQWPALHSQGCSPN